jgi:two-component system, cell cycle response regulator DivK
VARERVLIVEDNERNLRLVRDVLEFHGYTTLEARNAGDAIALAAAHRPRLVLMDIQLPDGDGVAVLKQLRSDPATAPIPVIALTAFAMREDRERLLAAGFDGYIAKPIDVRAFPGQLRAVLAATAAQRGGAGEPRSSVGLDE